MSSVAGDIPRVKLAEKALAILHLEDSDLDADLVKAHLARGGIKARIDRAENRQHFAACLEQNKYDLILSDYNLPGFDGQAALAMAREMSPGTPFIFLSGVLGEELATEMMRFGATDYVLKQRLARLAPAVSRALAEAEERAARLAAEAALKASHDQYRAAIANVLDYAIFVIGPDRRVKTWNKGAVQMLGYSDEEAIGMDFARLFTPAEQAAGEPGKQLDAAAAGEYRLEGVRVRKDGSQFQARAVLTAIRGHGGELTGCLTVVHDITHQRSAEAERERLLARERAARAEAETANRIKDEFLAVASHELRTPLNAILGWVGLLESSNDPQEIAEGLTVIHRNARHQAQLIEDILDVSRMITGRLRLSVHPHDLAPIVKRAIDTMRTAADAKGVKIEEAVENVGLVSCDAERMEQVVWNLVSNAIKFTPRGGRVSVGLASAASRVRLWVADTGMGIEPAFLPFVFERFRQADGSTTRRYGGLGLGLAIVRHLVELHGGSVSAHSDGEKRGSIFTVELPVMAVQKEDFESPRRFIAATDTHGRFECPPILAGRRVLVVEDDPDSRRLIKSVLEKCGAAVFSAASVAEAVEYLAGGQFPDLAISDIGMPHEDGYAFIRKLRFQETNIHQPRTPAAALTAYTRDEDRQAALAAGFDVFITKPVEPRELVNTLAGLLEKR
jgi:PAS domain S-box-containing protein